MIKFMEVRYSNLTTSDYHQMFSARKRTFKDRLNWMVDTVNEMEIDKYDNTNAHYIIGKHKDTLICGARLIASSDENMLNDGLFNVFFGKEIKLKENSLEVSRLFIDKEAIRGLSLSGHPIVSLLFRSMITFSKRKKYICMYAIVSHQMYIILRRAGWDVKIIETGKSEKQHTVHYISMPMDADSTSRLFEKTSIPEFIQYSDKEALLVSFPLRWTNNI